MSDLTFKELTYQEQMFYIDKKISKWKRVRELVQTKNQEQPEFVTIDDDALNAEIDETCDASVTPQMVRDELGE